MKKGTIEAMSGSEVKEIPGVYAGGDCVTGPATVIRAIAAGKVAAANIDEYLGYHHAFPVTWRFHRCVMTISIHAGACSCPKRKLEKKEELRRV